METKELKIIPPKGYIIDQENSIFEYIRFKPMTYEDVAQRLFQGSGYFIETDGTINNADFTPSQTIEPNNATSEKQLQKLLAINKLMNVAEYLNKDVSSSEYKYLIAVLNNDCIEIRKNKTSTNIGAVYFKTEELAKLAINILGKETILLAL